MRRRDFITLLGSAAAWPRAARAQQPAKPVIGYLGPLSPDVSASTREAFHKGLSESGFVEDRNVAIEYRWAEAHYDRFPALAADLVRRQVTLIVASGLPAALAAKAATTTIPIVFAFGNDPVQLGLVASLNRPGGNVTGATVLAEELGPKRVELLHELVPAAAVMALLVNPTNPGAEAISRDVQATARTLGLLIHVLHASTASDIDTVFATLTQLRAGALMIGTDAFFNSRNEQLAALTLRHAVPTIWNNREFTAAGGLMSYGASVLDSNRLAGVYAGRILKGEKPVDLPVQQSTKIEMFINLKTAKALGITVPLALLTRADEVIE
jgi:putative ABC transport system substrate-binding protein